MPGSTNVEIEKQIAAGADALGQPISAEKVAKLARLIGELARWNARISLTAIREPADMVAGHILDSLAVRPLLKGRRVLDVGTGAGFPGLPLAIAEADSDFVLLDSNARKISFVRHAIALLGLGNATAVESRAEDYAPGDGFDTVIARALASTQKLLGLAGHLLAKDGVLLALKGKHPAAELEEIRELPGWKYKVLQLTVPGIETRERHVVCLRKADNA